MRMPGAGELNRRVLIRERQDFPDEASGDLVSSFANQATTWAKVEPVGSALYSAGVQAEDRVTHRVTVRYRTGITDGFEVVEVINGRPTVYRVRRSSDLNNARRFTVLEVEEL